LLRNQDFMFFFTINFLAFVSNIGIVFRSHSKNRGIIFWLTLTDTVCLIRFTARSDVLNTAFFSLIHSWSRDIHSRDTTDWYQLCSPWTVNLIVEIFFLRLYFRQVNLVVRLLVSLYLKKILSGQSRSYIVDGFLEDWCMSNTFVLLNIFFYHLVWSLVVGSRLSLIWWHHIGSDHSSVFKRHSEVRAINTSIKQTGFWCIGVSLQHVFTFLARTGPCCYV